MPLVDALFELCKCALAPQRTRLAHAGSVARVDAADLSGRVVVVAVELVGISVRVFNGELAELARIGRRCDVGPGVLVEEHDLDAHRFAGCD
jgi:hypothetical protein